MCTHQPWAKLPGEGGQGGWLRYCLMRGVVAGVALMLALALVLALVLVLVL